MPSNKIIHLKSDELAEFIRKHERMGVHPPRILHAEGRRLEQELRNFLESVPAESTILHPLIASRTPLEIAAVTNQEDMVAWFLEELRITDNLSTEHILPLLDKSLTDGNIGRANNCLNAGIDANKNLRKIAVRQHRELALHLEKRTYAHPETDLICMQAALDARDFISFAMFELAPFPARRTDDMQKEITEHFKGIKPQEESVMDDAKRTAEILLKQAKQKYNGYPKRTPPAPAADRKPACTPCSPPPLTAAAAHKGNPLKTESHRKSISLYA